MSNIFFILDSVNTPLTEEQTNKCIQMYKTLNEYNTPLDNEIHVTETVKGHVVVINKNISLHSNDYIMFGLKNS